MHVKLADPAIDDLEAIGRWLGASAPEWVQSTEDGLRYTLELLAEFPEIGRPGRVRGTRELPVRRTPYMLVYATIKDTLWVLRVIHKSRQWPPRDESNQ